MNSTNKMDHESTHVRSPESLTVTVLRARYLRGQRGDVVSAVVRVEFNDKNLGESAKVECSADVPAEINHHSNINVTFEDPLALDELATKPVLLTILEVLPKERKQKEEKTIVLGQCTVDIFPIIAGETKVRQTLTINAVPDSPLEKLAPDLPRSEIDVQLSVNEPILTETQLRDCNLMSITVESLYSTPESWSLAGAQYTYTAVLPVPLTMEKENPVVFVGGHLKPGIDKEPACKRKKWALPGNALGNSVYIPEKVLPVQAVEDEDGDYRNKEDKEHRSTSEQDKNRVVWNIERRCYLDPAATKSFQDKIAKTRYWPVEVFRMPIPAAGKAKKDEELPSFHGVAYLNLAPLLYPGVDRIRGAYKVTGYHENELAEKTQRKGTLMDEAVRIAGGISSRTGNSPFPKANKKEDAKPKDPKKVPSIMKAGDSSSEADDPTANAEGQQYIENKSYLMVEIALKRPLVQKRQPEELTRRVATYIPPRPKFPKRTDGAKKSMEEFHLQVGIVANQILNEFRDQFGEIFSSEKALNTPEAMEQRKQKLIYHLNTTGKYLAFKEQIKHAVVKIVREKYLKTTAIKDQAELQAFLSELYVYLIDQMHQGLGQVLNIEDQNPIPDPLTDSAQLKHFAREAEVNENFELAARYYQERIARDGSDPDNWLDYGTFNLYINDLTKAEECFKECVSIDQRHLHGLLLYGIVCTMQDKHEAAETFFEAATTFEPKSILAWTLLGMFYDGIGNEIGAEMALQEASKLNVMETASLHGVTEESMDQDELIPGDIGPESPVDNASLPAHQSDLKPPDTATKGKGRAVDGVSQPDSVHAHDDTNLDPVLPRETTPVPSKSIYMQAVEFLLEVKAMPFTERALAHHLLDMLGGPSAEYNVCLARLKLQKHELDQAEQSLREALQFDHQNPDAWSILGHVKYLTGDTATAKDCYERTLAFVADASEMHSIYLRLASIYLQEGRFSEARSTFLMACKRSASCISWLGVGIACYRLGELSEAEDALAEANLLNNNDPEVWAYLSLVCLKTGRELEAEQSYKYANKLNLQDKELLEEINLLQEAVGFGNPSLG